MRKEDVLISEYRVTVLGDGGQYTFDWVDEDKRTVKFLKSKSDFSDYNDEVRDALGKKGISIHQEGDATKEKNDMGGQSGSMMDNIGGQSTSDSKSTNAEPITPNNPDQETESSGDSTFSPKSSSQEEDSINNDSFSPVESDVESTSSDKKDGDIKTNNSNTKSQEEVSFIVRMSDASEREKAIKMIEGSSHESSIDKLRLTGPFRVTYRIESGSVELVEVEDMGIGSNVED